MIDSTMTHIEKLQAGDDKRAVKHYQILTADTVISKLEARLAELLEIRDNVLGVNYARVQLAA